MHELAAYNFNNAGYALIRKDAQQQPISQITPPDRTPRPDSSDGAFFSLPLSHRLVPGVPHESTW
jgi:hypothetical protein